MGKFSFLQYLQVQATWLEQLQEVPSFQHLPSHVILSLSPLHSYSQTQVYQIHAISPNHYIELCNVKLVFHKDCHLTFQYHILQQEF